jgi:M6 family metalloprotease-like protein
MLFKAVVLLALTHKGMGMPASPIPFSPAQANGHPTACMMQVIGNPGYHYVICQTAPEGFYSTAINQKDGLIYYGKLEDGKLVPGDDVVGEVDPEEAGIELYQIESAKTAHESCMKNDYCKWKIDNNGLSNGKPIDSEYSNLVVPFYFADHEDRKLDVEALETDVFNDDHISVKDFFEGQSYGKMKWKNTFTEPVIISKKEIDCADNVSGTSNKMKDCLEEVLSLLEDASPKDFDGVTFIHSGYGAEFGGRDEDLTYLDDRIWSHSWELDSKDYKGRYALISGFYGASNGRYQHAGVAIHEIAQMLGAPTQYGPEPGNGLGNYDVMASPFGFDGHLHNCGSLSAYSKVLLEWADVEEITEEGEYTIDSSDTSNKVYKISKGFPKNEYFLIENRNGGGYDKGMRGLGLAIYHIDESANGLVGHPEDGEDYPKNHYIVSLVQADGLFDLEREEDQGDNGDLFRTGLVDGITPDGPLIDGKPTDKEYPNTKAYSGGKFKDTGITIKDISVPGKTMTFTVSFGESSSS